MTVGSCRLQLVGCGARVVSVNSAFVEFWGVCTCVASDGVTLSVGGGVCDLLVALTTCSLPRHHCSLLSLLLWTATVACGVMVSFLLRLVSLVCAVVIVCG
jgi:hypothetical protein